MDSQQVRFLVAAMLLAALINRAQGEDTLAALISAALTLTERLAQEFDLEVE